jgi:hypothetical protein
MNDQKYKHGRFTQLEVTKYISAVKLKVPPFVFKVFEHVMLWMGHGVTRRTAHWKWGCGE